jgi:hypothetical protein
MIINGYVCADGSKVSSHYCLYTHMYILSSTYSHIQEDTVLNFK